MLLGRRRRPMRAWEGSQPRLKRCSSTLGPLEVFCGLCLAIRVGLWSMLSYGGKSSGSAWVGRL